MNGDYTSVFLRNEFTVAPGEIPPALLLRFILDDGMLVWINGVEVHRENLDGGVIDPGDTANASGDEQNWIGVELGGAASYVVEGSNTIAIQAFNDRIASSDFGLDLELIRPMSGDEQPPRPTPGARNSNFAANAAPAIRQVDHSPEQPATGEPVVISARVTDPDGVGAVTLEYQTVAPGAYVPAFLAKPTTLLRSDPNAPRDPNPAYEQNWVQVAMVDDGGGNFSATLPGQTNRMLVRYRITVGDALGNNVRVPYADDTALNFAYFVYDGIPDYVAETRSVLGAPHTYPAEIIESVPVYQIITTPQDFDQAVGYDSADRIDRDNYDARSAYNWSCSFVYDGVVYDNIEYRLRQRNARYNGNGKRSFKFRFNRGSYPTFHDMQGNEYPTEWKFLASHRLRGSRGNHWGLEQAANHVLWNLTGTPAPFTHWFHLRVIRGAEEAPGGENGQYLGDYYGLLLALEEFDVRFLDAHNLEKGNLYKLISGRTDGVSVRRYQARDAVDDGSDFQNIIFGLRPSKDNDWLNQHVNYDSWNLYHAIVDAVRHYDVQPNTSEHLKNRAYYFEPSTETPLGRLWVLPWDSDTSWGPNWNGGEGFCKNALYGSGAPDRSDFHREYRNVVREIRDLIWTEEQINLLLDPLAASIAPLVPADRDRWTNAIGGSQTDPTLESAVADMKKFAFVGGSWTGGSPNVMDPISRDTGISGQQGRDAYLDALSADAEIPDTPTITYTGTAGFPQDGLGFQSSAFSDPQGNATFGAMEWRIAEITPIGGDLFPVLDRGAAWKYLDDGSDQGTAWREINFDDAAWNIGPTPAGYGGITNTTIETVVDFGPSGSDKHITTYFRTTVDVDDPAQIDHFTFEMNIDDGAVVYVNGTEVIRDRMQAGVEISSETRANLNGNEGIYDEFEVAPDAFVAGENTIAVEVHQEAPGSADLAFDMAISAQTLLLPPGSSVAMEWTSSWESGVLPAFDPNIAPPSSAVSVGNTYRARVRHQDNTQRWSHWSDPVQFVATSPDVSAWIDGIMISEINYHPTPPTLAELAIIPTLDSSDFEWVEIMNIGATALDLSDLRFTKGIEFDFIDGSRSTIAPGERLVVVADPAAFNLRYGHASTPAFVVGTFSKNLSNGGERLKLSFGGGTPVRDFDYSDNHPWPEAADGDGPSLVLIAPESAPDHAVAENWRASGNHGGTPGASDATTFAGSPDGDDDGNGISNFVQYAAGTEFVVGTITVDGSAFPTISFTRNLLADDVTVSAEVSNDLLDWRSGNGDVVRASESYLGDGSSLVTWRSTRSIENLIQQEFLRLRIQQR